MPLHGGVFPKKATFCRAVSGTSPRSRLLRDRLVKLLYGEASLLYFLAELNEFNNLEKGLER